MVPARERRAWRGNGRRQLARGTRWPNVVVRGVPAAVSGHHWPRRHTPEIDRGLSGLAGAMVFTVANRCRHTPCPGTTGTSAGIGGRTTVPALPREYRRNVYPRRARRGGITPQPATPPATATRNPGR